MLKNNIIIILTILILTVFGVFWFNLYKSIPKDNLENKNISKAQPSPIPSKLVFDVQAKYSDEFKEVKENTNDLKIVKNIADKGTGPTNYILVSRIPKDKSYSNNYIAVNGSYVSKLDMAKVDDQIILDESQKDYFTYSRQEDININTKPAKMFINFKPWEFPKGTKETVYIVKPIENTIYVILSYTNSGDYYNITEQQAKDIVSTIDFK